MASRRLVSASARETLFGIPSDIASLERNYLLADDDLDLIGTRRRPENRLGLALHIALLRHPGQGWHDDTEPPAPLVAWLAEQIEVPFPSLARYGSRGQRAPTTGGWASGISACVRSCLRTTCEQRWTWLPGQRSTPTTGASFLNSTSPRHRASCQTRRRSGTATQ